MVRKPLTDAAIRAMKPPPKGYTILWDGSLRGFGCRISQAGTRAFIVLVASGRTKTIGRYDVMSLSKARTKAKEMLAEKTLGRLHPQRYAWQDAVDEFLTDCRKRNRRHTIRDYTRHLATHYPFERRNVADITPREIVRNLNKINNRPTEKEHAFKVGRTFFRWCVRQHIIDRSPMEYIAVPSAPRSRERVLDENELKELLRALQTNETAYKRLVLLLVLTGQRRGEITALEWKWIDRDEKTITFPSSLTKNRRTHTIPYGDMADAVFEAIPRINDNPYVFPASKERVKGKPATTFNGFSKAKVQLDKELENVEPWTLHDLRRTFSSHMAALGVEQIVVEKLLNHVSGGTQSPIAQIYNRYSYMTEMRDAVRKWEGYLQELMKR